MSTNIKLKLYSFNLDSKSGFPKLFSNGLFKEIENDMTPINKITHKTTIKNT